MTASSGRYIGLWQYGQGKVMAYRFLLWMGDLVFHPLMARLPFLVFCLASIDCPIFVQLGICRFLLGGWPLGQLPVLVLGEGAA